MIRLNSDKHIIAILTPKERSALLEQSTVTDDLIYEKVRNSKFGNLALSAYELQLLLRAINYEIKHAKTPKLKKIFRKLYERLVNDFSVSLTSNAEPGTLPNTLEALLHQGPFGSIDELNLRLQDFMNAHNELSDSKMGNLSPNQVNKLIYSKWEASDRTIKLNENLVLSDLQEARFLLNARIFLEALANQEGDTATAKGNLNRKLTKLSFERMHWRPGHKEDTIRFNKVLNEHDVQPLHIVRVICELARLVRRRKRKFLVTNKGQQLLAEQKAGELYTLLFRTFFRQFNLSYLDGLPECYGLQGTIAYSLYRLTKVAASWQTPESLVQSILLPKVKEQIQQSLSVYIKPHWFIEARLIRPLDDFGLLECSYDNTCKVLIMRPEKIRKTGLFDKFINFSF